MNRHRYQLWIAAVCGVIAAFAATAMLSAIRSGGSEDLAGTQDLARTDTEQSVVEPQPLESETSTTPPDGRADQNRSDDTTEGSTPALVVGGSTVVTNDTTSTTSSSTTRPPATKPPTAPPTTPPPTTAPPTTATPTERPTTAPPTTASPKKAPPTTAPPTTQAASGGGQARDFERQVIVLTNEHRRKAGCGDLTHNDRLHAAALGHSTDMAVKNYFSHTSIDGSSMSDRINRQGYSWRSIGENIAAGQRTPAEVVTGWMNSPGHRANILNCGFTEIGVGLALTDGGSYRYFWTQNFGTRR